ncbi:MAG: hypothetical protein WA871_08765 [Candidatus Acidiferrales bacterium]
MSENERWIVELDGAEYAFGDLTLDQLVELFAIERDGEQCIFGWLAAYLVKDYLREGKTITAVAVVTQALNNGLADGEPEWTAEEVRDEIGSLEFEMLKSGVIDLSWFVPKFGSLEWV